MLNREMLRTFALALAAGIFVAVSPFTPADVLISSLAGLLAAGFVVVYRHTHPSKPAEDPNAEGEAGDPRPVVPRIPLPVWVALGLVLIFSMPTLLLFYESWTEAIWINGHGIFMPIIMFVLARSALRRDPHPEAVEASAWGVPPLVVALALMVVDAVIQTGYLAAIGFVILLPALSLLLLGMRRTKLLALPLIIGIFMIPIPNTVATHLYLKTWTAIAVEPMIRMVGVPVLRQQTVLVLPRDTFMVADACSGFSTLYAAVGLSIILARYCRSNLRRILIMIAAWPLALACNILRVFILVMGSHLWGVGMLESPLHAASGVATFWIALTGLFLISDRDSLRAAVV